MNPATQLFLFCIPGKHRAEHATGTVADGAFLPKGWKKVPASILRDEENPEDKIWVKDFLSPASIIVCPEHKL